MDDWKVIALSQRERKQRHSISYIATRVGKTEEEVRELFKAESAEKKAQELFKAESAEKKAQELAANKAIPDKEKAEKVAVFENLVPISHPGDWSGNTIVTFGLIGDTHFNSKYSQLTYLHQYYDICAKRGLKDIYHTGDIDEGEQMRMGHQYECYTQGADDHVNEIAARYPAADGVTTHFITGNHDASIYKRCGVDIGRVIASKRHDLDYLGSDCAKIAITPNCILELRHPWDGTAYAVSYKVQKMIESMDADSKPNILAVGHYHKLEYLFHRNVHCFQTGCFQSQTPFTRGKGISVHMGGWIVTVEVDTKGHVQRIIPEMIPFYKGITSDYSNFGYSANG